MDLTAGYSYRWVSKNFENWHDILQKGDFRLPKSGLEMGLVSTSRPEGQHVLQLEHYAGSTASLLQLLVHWSKELRQPGAAHAADFLRCFLTAGLPATFPLLVDKQVPDAAPGMAVPPGMEQVNVMIKVTSHVVDAYGLVQQVPELGNGDSRT